MSFKVKPTKGAGEKPEVEAGSHGAVCVGLIDLGTQETQYGDEAAEWKRQIYLCFELPGIAGRGSGHLVLARALTLSLNEKATLRKWVEAWRGKPVGEDEEFDVANLLGKKCLLTVGHNKGGYPVINGVAKLPNGMAVPDAGRPKFLFSLEAHNPGDEIPIPDWVPYFYGEKVADVIERCRELNGGGDLEPDGEDTPATGDASDEEVPF